ncbi:hypothetical protein CF1_0115 [Staphylococcus phage CF1]|nr:hypothetical protein CF1_0115 [Staphylococcus phage CF1]
MNKEKTKTFKIINDILLNHEIGNLKHESIKIVEVVGLQEESGIIFGALECEYNNYCYLTHFEIGNRWAYPNNDDIKEIETALFSVIDEEIKKHFKN